VSLLVEAVHSLTAKNPPTYQYVDINMVRAVGQKNVPFFYQASILPVRLVN
jgi:hypothetical protein